MDNEQHISIQVRDLHKAYRLGEVEHPALNGVTLDIAAGGFAVLAGRSGSGKTTLLNIIGGLESADRGSVRVNGVDLLSLSASARSDFRLHHVGFVFQAYNLVRVLSARENVAYVCRLQGKPEGECFDIADHCLEAVELAEFKNRRPEQLSGGQQQRVAVARALASRPDIVLADEPTANLDTATGRHLIDLMKRLNRERDITFLISSHDPDVIRSADRVIPLEDGRAAG